MSVLKRITRNSRIPLTMRKKIGKFVEISDHDNAFEIPVFEAIYTGKHGIHMDHKIDLYGFHEASTIRLLRAILKWQRTQNISPVYWDIGTNSGFHLTTVSPMADYALGFEPWDLVRKRAEHNIARNNYSHVTIMPFGLSDTDSEKPFLPSANNNLGTGSFRDAEKCKDAITLKVKRGDAVMDKDGHAPSLLKIDIEGHEVPALKGLSKTISTHKPVIVFEYDGGSRTDLADLKLRKTLFGSDYRFFGIRRSREYPKLVAFDPRGKYENVLAWPHAEHPREVLNGFYDF